MGGGRRWRVGEKRDKKGVDGGGGVVPFVGLADYGRGFYYISFLNIFISNFCHL